MAWHDGLDDGDEIELEMSDGSRMAGKYRTVAAMHFVQVPGGALSSGSVKGPFEDAEILAVRRTATCEEVLDALFERTRGEPVPGRLRRDREGYRARLEMLARQAVGQPFVRRSQIVRQFDDVADEIALAKTKRKWMLAVAAWSRHSNTEPEPIDLSNGCMVTAAKFAKPRDRDFDPDPVERRKRDPVPEHVRIDPMSVRNMKAALRAHGFKARASVLGITDDDRANLLVDFPGGKEFGRFMMTAKRVAGGAMSWRARWDGNDSTADQRRRRKCVRSEAYETFAGIVRGGSAFVANEAPPDERPAPTPILG